MHLFDRLHGKPTPFIGSFVRLFCESDLEISFLDKQCLSHLKSLRYFAKMLLNGQVSGPFRIANFE